MTKIYNIDDVIAQRSKVRLPGRQLAFDQGINDNAFFKKKGMIYYLFDCREIAQRKSNGNLYATNPQCNYDPYKGKWMEQNGEFICELSL